MSYEKAVEQSRARLVANMIVAMPVIAVLIAIRVLQQPKATSVDGWAAPHEPL